MAITLRINGREHALEIAGNTPLLYALRTMELA
jgi:aerobic-type carbon monoxide dehydrogenase small subunit (CoxS/CutS family)